MIVLFVIPLLLCWGSFLNVIAHRVITEQSIITPRSHCPQCRHPLAWYDLVPLISWLQLRGSCRYCQQTISHLYPFIEFLTVLIGVLLITHISSDYWLAYATFFSALLVTIRTDLEHMLISQYMTLYLIPLNIFLSYFDLLPLSAYESIAGALIGYGFLYGLSYLFHAVTGKDGIGEGDFDLLAYIGSCVGIIGCWLSLTIGSLLGSIIGIAYLFFTKQTHATRIPFGPFLAAGAIIYVLFQDDILSFFFF